MITRSVSKTLSLTEDTEFARVLRNVFELYVVSGVVQIGLGENSDPLTIAVGETFAPRVVPTSFIYINVEAGECIVTTDSYPSTILETLCGDPAMEFNTSCNSMMIPIL